MEVTVNLEMFLLFNPTHIHKCTCISACTTLYRFTSYTIIRSYIINRTVEYLRSDCRSDFDSKVLLITIICNVGIDSAQTWWLTGMQLG